MGQELDQIETILSRNDRTESERRKDASGYV